MLAGKLAGLENVRSFHELYGLLQELADGVNGVGDLYVYDLAVHVGAKLALTPDRVYLHRGTRKGARRLRHASRKSWLERQELPPYEVEDILCVYKDRF